MKSRVEVEKMLGLTKRQIQLCEKEGIAIKPSEKNKYGHNVYGIKEIERLWMIKLFYELNYKKDNFKKIIQSEDFSEEDTFKNIMIELQEKISKLQKYLDIIKKMNEYRLGFNDIFYLINGVDEEINFSDLNIYGSILSMMPNETELNITKEQLDIISAAEWNKYIKLIEKILQYKSMLYSERSTDVQTLVNEMYQIMSKYISHSLSMFLSQHIVMFGTENNTIDINNNYGEGASEYLIDAINYYCHLKKEDKGDLFLGSSIENIIDLLYEGHSFDSEEVQSQVKRLHEFYKGLLFYTENQQIMFLKMLKESFENKDIMKEYDNDNEKSFCKLISDSIGYYLKKLNGLEGDTNG